MECTKHENCCFSHTGFGLANEVFPEHYVGDTLGLDLGWILEPCFSYATEKLFL